MRLVVPVLTRVLAALAALAILAAGVVVLVELISNWTGNGFAILPEDWPDQLRVTSWDDAIVRNLLIAALVVGVVLLLVACWPHPPLTVPTNEPNVRIERHALESAVRRRLLGVDGASGARVRATTHRIDARVDTTRRLEPQRVHEAATHALTEFCAQHQLALEPHVRLRARGDTR